MRWIVVIALTMVACGSGGSSSCGNEGQSCCANAMCGSGLVCAGIAGNEASHHCARCGQVGEFCCDSAPRCATGTMCGRTVDTTPLCEAATDGGTD